MSQESSCSNDFVSGRIFMLLMRKDSCQKFITERVLV